MRWVELGISARRATGAKRNKKMHSMSGEF